MSGEKEIPGTQPLQASSFRIGGHILLKDKYPCKIVEMTTSKTGKHGHAKVHFVGIDIFTGNKHEELQASTHNMLEVIVTKRKYLVVYIDKDNGNLELLDENNDPKEDLQLNSEDLEWRGRGEQPFGYRVLQAFELKDDKEELWVTVVTAIGHSQVKEFNIVQTK